MLDLLLLLGTTKAKILDLMLERRRTAKEVAERLDIQVSAARKHLESLKEMGLAECSLASEGVGRPKKYFKLTESGKELLYPRQYSNVLNILLMKLVHKRGAPEVETILREIADDVLGQLETQQQQRQQQTPDNGTASRSYDRLLSSLSHFGFESTVEDGDGRDETLSIVTRNCPMLKVASMHHDLICNGFHNQILKSALDTRSVSLRDCLASGDSLCRHVVPKNLLRDEDQQG